jgi:hypothetical protein
MAVRDGAGGRDGAANLSAGSNYVRRAGESFLVRADARLKSIEDIQEAVVATRNGIPVRVKDVGPGRDRRCGPDRLGQPHGIGGGHLDRADAGGRQQPYRRDRAPRS